MNGRRVILAAGGTGGHFFPAEALAAELTARGHAIALMTDRRGQDRAPDGAFAGVPVAVLAGGGLAGRGVASAARSALALAAGTMQAWAALRRLHPSAIVGFGGYPSVPPVLGRRLLRRAVPVVLHEQNAVLGRANRFLARAGGTILALSYAATRTLPAGVATVVTGNPVRPAIGACAASPYAPPAPDGPIRVLVTGGSLGARIFSTVVPAALTALPPGVRARLVITQQAREADLAAVRAAYEAAGLEVTLASFFNDMAARIVAAHLVIGRAGASTLAELAVIGRPAVLVPLPGAIDDHQSANAAALGAGAWQLREAEFVPALLTALLTEILTSPTSLPAAAAEMARHGRPDAAARLADVVEAAIRESAS